MTPAIAQLLRLSIGKKLLLAFLSYGVLTVIIALFSLSTLDQLTEINQSINLRDLPILEITDRMVETILAQEIYANQSLIRKSPDLRVLFWNRSEEFKKLIDQLKVLPPGEFIPVDQLATLQEEYTQIFNREFKSQLGPSSSAKDFSQQMRAKQEEIIRLVRKISWAARQDQAKRSKMISDIGSRALWVAAGLCVVGGLLGILVTLIITRNISGPIHQLKLSTQEISEGRFDHLPQVQSRDELGELSEAFHEMAVRLKHLEELHLDANPLTRLPGGVAIEEVLKKRLREESPLAFCLLDLRHFKAFNDRYGYARGNEIILATAEIIQQAVQEHGGADDFIGHIGGDDFVIMTSPPRHEKICSAVTETFDRKIQKFYDAEDLLQGYIQGKTRRGQIVSFPIMTISIAVVTNQYRKLQSHIQVGEIAAEMKNFAKSFPRSIYVVDKRRDRPPEGTG